MISALSALRMGLPFVKCEFAIYMRRERKFDLEFMLAVQRNLLSALFFQI